MSMLNRTNKLNRVVSGCVAIVVCIACASAEAQVTQGSDTDWLAGKPLLDSKLLPVSVAWTDAPLRRQLNQFATQRKRSIFLDRRVDPTIKQSFQFLDNTTEQIVWQTAKANGLGVARVGDLLYVGPKQSAARLPFVIQNVKKNLSKTESGVRKNWTVNSEIKWPDGTTTQEVLNWFTESKGIKFSSDLPLDVFPETDWPRLSTLEQLSLLLVGFDLSFEYDARSKLVSFIPFPKIATAKLKISLARESKLDLEVVAQNFSDLKIRRSGKTLSVAGPTESIAELEAWMVVQQELKTDGMAPSTFALNTTASRRGILETVAQQTGRKLILDGNVKQILQDRITIDLSGVSLEMLLNECLADTPLKYELNDNSLTIIEN